MFQDFKVVTYHAQTPHSVAVQMETLPLMVPVAKVVVCQRHLAAALITLHQHKVNIPSMFCPKQNIDVFSTTLISLWFLAGLNSEGCSCERSPYGCCPDNKTIARGYNNEGCGCQYTTHGCCPDNFTPAQGADFQGCSCRTFQFGCCPDGVTTAKGPHQQGNCWKLKKMLLKKATVYLKLLKSKDIKFYLYRVSNTGSKSIKCWIIKKLFRYIQGVPLNRTCNKINYYDGDFQI